MPTEQAFTAAKRLRDEGLDDASIGRQLLVLGFEATEAKVAVGALAPLVDGPVRSAVELERRAARDKGYMCLLLGAAVLGGGILMVLLHAVFFGGAVAAVGLVLVIMGAWFTWRGAALLER